MTVRISRRSVIAGSLLAATIGTTARAAGASTAVAPRLPRPSGPYPVGRVDLHLVDRSRPDPWLADRPYRELMAGVWYPSRPGGPAMPYQAELVARAYRDLVFPDLPRDVVDWPGIRSHAGRRAPALPGRRPVVLYSPKHLELRSYSTLLVEELASRGYVVVTTEGTHEALAVQFPGGRLERIKPAAIPDLTDPAALLANRRRTIASRAADLGFLVRWLAAGRPDRRLPAGLALDPDRIGMFGAVGGALAGLQAAYDGVPLTAVAGLPEVVGPPDEPWAPVVTHGVSVPFLQFSSQDGPENHLNSPELAAFWPKLRGWKLNAELVGSTWGSFCDYQALMPAIQRIHPPFDYGNNIGTIDPHRSIRAQRAYLTAFFDRHLRGRDSPLLHHESPGHPDVRLITG